MTSPLSLVPTPGSQRPRSLVEALIASRETTGLLPLDESAFRRWAAQRGISDVDDPESHYDYRGAYQGGADRSTNGHFTDQFKQHGHPTFSEESQYSAGHGDGGTWEGDRFIPPATSHSLVEALAPSKGSHLYHGHMVPDDWTPLDASQDPNGGDLPGIRDLVKQGARGLAEAGYGLAGGLANLLGGHTVADALKRNRDDMRAFYGEPQTGWGRAGQIGGNLVGSAALAAVPGALVGRAAEALPAASMGARALARLVNPLAAEEGLTGVASRAMGAAALNAPMAVGRSIDPETSTLRAVADATGSQGLQHLSQSPVARGVAELGTDVLGNAGMEAAANALPGVARNLKQVLGDRRGAVGDVAQLHPVDKALDHALSGLDVVYRPGEDAAEAVAHHSTRQPRTATGQFNGPPIDPNGPPPAGAMRLYHGSANDFDRFDLGKVGEGEGAQVYGHGLYFAESPEVAEYYRENTPSKPDVSIGGRRYANPPMNRVPPTRIAARGLPENSDEENIARSLSVTAWDMRRMNPGAPAPTAAEVLAKHAEDLAQYERVHGTTLTKARERHDLAAAAGVEIHHRDPQVYAVDAQVSPDNLLHWDLPLHQQPEPVRQSLSGMGIDVSKPPSVYLIRHTDPSGTDVATYTTRGGRTPQQEVERLRGKGHTVRSIDLADDTYPGETGASAYKALSDNLAGQGPYFVPGQVGGNAKGATEALLDAGIHGVRYSDAASRAMLKNAGGSSDGTHNVVLFSDRPIQIAAKARALEALRAELKAKGYQAFSAAPIAVGLGLLAKHGLTRNDVGDL